MQMYNTQEFAKKIGVDTTSLWRWHKTGAFKGRMTPGGRRFYTDEDVEKFFYGKEAEDDKDNSK
jgi:DNA-binding transcriptional MerR regulator